MKCFRSGARRGGQFSRIWSLASRSPSILSLAVWVTGALWGCDVVGMRLVLVFSRLFAEKLFINTYQLLRVVFVDSRSRYRTRTFFFCSPVRWAPRRRQSFLGNDIERARRDALVTRQPRPPSLLLLHSLSPPLNIKLIET